MIFARTIYNIGIQSIIIHFNYLGDALVLAYERRVVPRDKSVELLRISESCLEFDLVTS